VFVVLGALLEVLGRAGQVRERRLGVGRVTREAVKPGRLVSMV
jgi:hypothetical protein